MNPPTSNRVLHVVANAHVDPVWLWDWREGMHEVLQTFAAALDRLDETADLVFTASSASYYWWVEQIDPALFERIVDQVARGRWVITGGQWVEPDCNLTHGESICRQFLYGQRYFASRFGRRATVGYNIDSFGHAGSLPQLLARSGLEAYVFMRPEEHEKPLPSPLFTWVGIDGTRVYAYRIPFGYSTGGAMEGEIVRHRADLLLARGRAEHTPLMLFFGAGDHGGGPTLAAIAAIRDLVEVEAGDVGFSSPESYFQTVATRSSPQPVVEGELQWHAVGCFSALSAAKRANAFAERALLTAETMAELCRALTGTDLGGSGRLEDAWRALLFTQFHDSLGGTCTEPVHDTLDRFAAHARVIADVLTTQAVHTIVQRVDTRMAPTTRTPDDREAVPVVVFNPLSWNAVFALSLRTPVERVSDGHGWSTTTQPVPSGEITHHPVGALFQAEIPALGYRCLWAHRRRSPVAVVAGAGEDAVGDGEDAPEAGTGAVTATTTALRNRDLRVGIDTATGALVSIVDAVARREYLGPGGVYPVVIDDRSDTWSHGVDRYDGHEQPGRLLDLRVVETGPVRATVMIELAWGTSLVAQEVSVYADRPFVELRYRVDWHATERILKLVIPVLVADASTIAGIPYGWIARPPHGHEEVMQRWVDVSGRPSGPSGPGPVSGLGCTTDCKFAYDVLASRLRVTALRSPRYADHGMGWAGTDDRSYPVTDQGVQRFSVRLHPHAGGAVDAGLARLAEEHLVEPPVVVDAPHPGPLPPFSSGLSVDAGTVAVSVAKRAERGDGTVLRIHELDGRPTLATLALTAWGRRWEGPLGAHEVKTLYLPDRPDLPVREIDVTELWTD